MLKKNQLVPLQLELLSICLFQILFIYLERVGVSSGEGQSERESETDSALNAQLILGLSLATLRS